MSGLLFGAIPGPPVAWVNDRDLRELGFAVSRVSGVQALPARTPVHRQIPGRAGLLRTGILTPSAREIQLQGHLLADTPEGLEAVRDGVVRYLGAGPVTVSTAHAPDRLWVGELISDAAVAYEPQFGSSTSAYTATLLCADPTAADRSGRALVFGPAAAMARTPVELGTAPSPWVVRFRGPATNPTAVLRGPDGRELGRVGILVQLGADDYAAVSGVSYSAVLSLAGVATALPRQLLVGDFFALDPVGTDPEVGACHTIALDAPESGARGALLYRRQWW